MSNVLKSLYDFNNHKCVSIWRGYESGYRVMLCHGNPSVGVEFAVFKLQREAIAAVKRDLPDAPIWIEKTSSFVRYTA